MVGIDADLEMLQTWQGRIKVQHKAGFPGIQLAFRSKTDILDRNKFLVFIFPANQAFQAHIAGGEFAELCGNLDTKMFAGFYRLR